jgi:hypothetical protein
MTLKMVVVCSFKMFGSSYPATWHNNPDDLLPVLKKDLQLIKSFSTVSFAVGKAATFVLH